MYQLDMHGDPATVRRVLLAIAACEGKTDEELEKMASDLEEDDWAATARRSFIAWSEENPW